MKRRSFLYRLAASLTGAALFDRAAPAQETGDSKSSASSADLDAALKKKLGGERATIYPFDVRIGGQTAVIEGDPKVASFAKIANPVAADAQLEVDGVPGTLIVNVFPVRPNGEVPAGASAQTKVLFLSSGTKIGLNATMDQSVLTPGLYGANVVYAGTTSRVMFIVR